MWDRYAGDRGRRHSVGRVRRIFRLQHGVQSSVEFRTVAWPFIEFELLAAFNVMELCP